MRVVLSGLLALTVLVQPAAAETSLDRPDAFEHAYDLSLYQFDGCGDALAGRIYRRVLAVRFAQCPFTAEARGRYAKRTQAHLAIARQRMDDMIDRAGGLPVQLDGMTTTCHAHKTSDVYREFRAQLEAFNAGKLPANVIIPAPCDASDLAP